MRKLSALVLLSLGLVVGCGESPPSNPGSGHAGQGGGQGGSAPQGGASGSGAAGTTGAAGTGAAAGRGGTFGNPGLAGSTGQAGTGGQAGATAGTTGAGGAVGAAGRGGSVGSAGSGAGGRGGDGGTTITGGGGSAATSCTREALEAAAKTLADALGGDSAAKGAIAAAVYLENTKATNITAGIFATPVTVAFRRSLLDTETCQSFSEIIVTQSHPYVIGSRMKLAGGAITEIESLVTDDGDWLFDAAGYLRHTTMEDWSVIPEADRDTREVLIAAGNAYLDYFSDKTVVVPWGMPCNRLEGGSAYTNNTCNVGVPDGVTFHDKRWIVDRDLGTAVVLVRFGSANGLPDSHMFRSLKGKLRYVHTITVCTTRNCGM